MTAVSHIPTITLVGRPNVGKSTLFNRIAGSRKALVAATPGLTRDRREEEVRREGYHFRLVDTGGMAYSSEGDFSAEIAAQVELGVGSAEAVWMVVDAVEGLNPFDGELYRWLLRVQKPIFVIVNKADNPRRMADMADFYSLGAERIHAVSAIHGHGIGDALAETAALLPMAEEEEADGETERPIRITFLGRPNVGKSSLVNRILGDERMIVSELPGTTREAVDLPFELLGQTYLLIDTAGIRRRARTKEYLEKIGVLSSLGALRRTEIAVLVVDAADKIAEQDARIASYVLEQRRGIVVAMNKWDIIAEEPRRIEALEEGFQKRLRFLEFAPRVRTSAADGTGVERLFKEIHAVYENFNRRIQTADLNRVVQMSVLRQAPPAQGRVPTKVFYGSQLRERPPTFCFVTNHPKEIRESYTRYMENQLRYHFGLKGTPLHILWKGRREEGRKNRTRRG